MKRLLVTCHLLLVTVTAAANWETGRPYYDDGARVTVGVRGGVSQPKSTMKNQIGYMPVEYWYTTDGDGNKFWYISDPTCGGATPCDRYAVADLGAMTVEKSYDERAFAGGASVGVVWGGKPNLRTELDWLRIAKTSFMMNPLLSGDIETELDTVEHGESLSARAATSTDVFSAMIYYDFFKGMTKPTGSAVPYIGVGFGYAMSTTTLELTDTTHELAGVSFDGFGDQSVWTIDFFSSATATNTFSVSGAAGIAFGMGDGVFLDLGARATYVPEIMWSLNNAPLVSGTTTYKERPVFSANDVLFITIHAGLRFEF